MLLFENIKYVPAKILFTWKPLIREDLYNYLISVILPKYKNVDIAHDEQHIRESLCYAKSITNLLRNKITLHEMELIFTAILYHDVSLVNSPRETHHINSAKIVKSDKILKSFFNQKDINIIADAVEDHRSSSNKPPRSLVGKVVADSDTGPIQIDNLIRRSYYYHVSNSKEENKLKIFDEIFNSLNKKYGKNGYSKYWLKESEHYFNLISNNAKERLSNREYMMNEYNKFLKQTV